MQSETKIPDQKTFIHFISTVLGNSSSGKEITLMISLLIHLTDFGLYKLR